MKYVASRANLLPASCCFLLDLFVNTEDGLEILLNLHWTAWCNVPEGKLLESSLFSYTYSL
jgi:hypothetical protein